MALQLGSAVIAVRVDNAALKSGLKQSQRIAATRFGQIAASAKASAAVVRAAWMKMRTAVLAGVIVLGLAVKAAGDAARAQAKLAGVLKATGGVSGQTVESLNAYSAAMQHLTESEDDAITNAQAMLLTFKNISGDTFPAAMTAVLDMASTLDGDLKGAVIIIGKALNDPILGITALNRAGVQFTQDQRNTVKALVETNNVLGAQAIIMAELKGQMGGVAVAAGDSLSGSMMRLKNASGDLLEALGNLVTKGGALDTLTDMLTGISELIDNIRGAGDFINRFLPASVAARLQTVAEFTSIPLMLARSGRGARERAVAAGGPGVPGSDSRQSERALEAIADNTRATARNTKDGQGGLT